MLIAYPHIDGDPVPHYRDLPLGHTIDYLLAFTLVYFLCKSKWKNSLLQQSK